MYFELTRSHLPATITSQLELKESSKTKASLGSYCLMWVMNWRENLIGRNNTAIFKWTMCKVKLRTKCSRYLKSRSLLYELMMSSRYWKAAIFLQWNTWTILSFLVRPHNYYFNNNKNVILLYRYTTSLLHSLFICHFCGGSSFLLWPAVTQILTGWKTTPCVCSSHGKNVLISWNASDRWQQSNTWFWQALLDPSI